MRMVRLCDVILELQSGARPKGGVSSETGTIPSLGAEHLSESGDFHFHKNKYITTDFFNNLKSGKIKYNDILIVKDGATTGKVSFVNYNFPFNKAAINEHVFRIAIDQLISFPKYIYFFLKSSEGKKQILNDFRGATVGGISRQFIETTKIPLPSLDDQIRISTVLTKVEALIAKRKESIKGLDELIKSIFLEMCGSFNKPKYQMEKIKDYSLKITDGTHQSPIFLEKGIPFLLVSNIVNNEICYETKKFISEDEHSALNKRTPIEIGDLLFTTVGSYGKAALVKRNTKFAFQRHIAYIKPNKAKINPVFLFGAMMSDVVKKQVDKSVRGVAQLTLNLADLKQIKIPIPPLSIQNQFATIVEKIESIKLKYSSNLIELERLFRSLGQRAFKGELDLSNVPVLVNVKETEEGSNKLIGGVDVESKSKIDINDKDLAEIIKTFSSEIFSFDELLAKIKSVTESEISRNSIQNQILKLLESDKKFEQVFDFVASEVKDKKNVEKRIAFRGNYEN